VTCGFTSYRTCGRNWTSYSMMKEMTLLGWISTKRLWFWIKYELKKVRVTLHL